MGTFNRFRSGLTFAVLDEIYAADGVVYYASDAEVNVFRLRDVMMMTTFKGTLLVHFTGGHYISLAFASDLTTSKSTLVYDTANTLWGWWLLKVHPRQIANSASFKSINGKSPVDIEAEFMQELEPTLQPEP